MPKRAIENGGIVHIMNLQEIAEMISIFIIKYRIHLKLAALKLF